MAKAFHISVAATGGAFPTNYKAIQVEGLEFHITVNDVLDPISLVDVVQEL